MGVLAVKTGGGGGIDEFCDVNIIVPSNDTPRIQEMHILIGHIISQSVDDFIGIK